MRRFNLSSTPHNTLSLALAPGAVLLHVAWCWQCAAVQNSVRGAFDLASEQGCDLLRGAEHLAWMQCGSQGRSPVARAAGGVSPALALSFPFVVHTMV